MLCSRENGDGKIHILKYKLYTDLYDLQRRIAPPSF